jgi:hypothetical protein
MINTPLNIKRWSIDDDMVAHILDGISRRQNTPSDAQEVTKRSSGLGTERVAGIVSCSGTLPDAAYEVLV